MFRFVHLNYNNTLSNNADYGYSLMGMKMQKVTYFNQKRIKQHLLTQKALFSEAVNTKEIRFLP